MDLMKLFLIAVIALIVVFMVIIPAITFLLKGLFGGYLYYKEWRKKGEQ